MGAGSAAHPCFIVLASTALIVVIGAIDAMTGVELSVQLLYLGPCSVVAWKVGRREALALTSLSALVWLTADIYDGHSYSHPLFAASNALTLLVFLAASSWVIAAMASNLSRESRSARVDHLSGLWNARAFYELAEREATLAARQGTSLAVAYLDLDDFKHVNDTWGHLAADELLRIVARALRDAVRASDIVGRLGGDEFAVVFPRASVTEAEQILRRALDSVSAATQEAGFKVTFSLGCAGATGSEVAMKSLLRDADRDMYVAKAARKRGAVPRHSRGVPLVASPAFAGEHE